MQTTVMCDFIILYFTKNRTFYKGVKYLLVDGEDAEVVFNNKVFYEQYVLFFTFAERTTSIGIRFNLWKRQKSIALQVISVNHTIEF